MHHLKKILIETSYILDKYYNGGETVKQVNFQSLRRKNELMHMEKLGQKIGHQFSKLTVVVNQIKTCDEVITKQKVIQNVMRSQSLRFDFIVVASQDSKDLKTMKIKEFQQKKFRLMNTW